MGISAFYRNFPHFYGNLKKACPIVKGYVFSNKWELFDYYRNLKKACPIVKGYVLSNKWELSDFYRNFLLFMGIWRKLALLSKAQVD
jgi:hypothetical protein